MGLGWIVRLGENGIRVVPLAVVAMMIVASASAMIWVAVESRGGVSLIVGTDKRMYSEGEPVRIDMCLKNYGWETVNLVYANSLIFVFSICDSKGEVVFTGPRAALMVITEVELGPGESKNSGWNWDQNNDTGRQVDSPGLYVLHVSSFCGEHRFYADTAFVIV